MNERYILEHQTRGTVVDQDHDPYGSGPCVHLEWRTRFSPTGPRTDAAVYFSLDAARMALSRISPNLRKWTKIRRYGTWSEVQP